MKLKTVKFTLAQRDQILALLSVIGGDGHTIFDPSILSAFPPEMGKRFVRRYTSDGSAKGSIFGHDGKVLPGLVGIYGLNVLYSIARDLNLSYESAMGRGTQARLLTSAIHQALNG